MENSSPLILEISSDEEVSFGDTRKGTGCGVGVGEFGDKDDCDWLSELLVDDLDDVLLVSETSPNPSKIPRLEPLKPAAKVVGDDDDDCVVLDGDPDKPVEAPAIGKVDNGGDVEIVGQKGEVACRDFPHARHLCAKFHFASTRHEVHCSQCHCYVCDSLAPCSHWGTGVSSIDHCHATDKDEYWRAERKRMKRVVNPVPAVPPINNNNPILGPLFQPTQAPAPPRPTVTPFFPMSVMSPNVTGPSAANRARAHPVQVYRPQPQFVPPANKIQNLKRPGLVRAPKNYFSPHGPQLPRNPLTNIVERKTPLLKGCCAVKGHHGTHQLKTGNRPFHYPQQINYPKGVVNVGRANYVHSLPYSSSLIRDALHQSQSQTHSQPYVSSSSTTTTTNNNFVRQPRMASQPSVRIENLILRSPHVFGTHISVPYQNAQSYQSNAGNAFGCKVNSRFTIPSNQNAPLQAHVNPASLLFDIPNDYQQGNQAENGMGTSPNDFGLASEVSQCPSTGPTITSQVHGVEENNNSQSIEPVGSFQQGVVLEDNSSLTKDAGSLFPASIPHDMLDFQFDNWMFENDSLAGVLEAPVSPLWNTFSPEPASTIDTGDLLDF